MADLQVGSSRTGQLWMSQCNELSSCQISREKKKERRKAFQPGFGAGFEIALEPSKLQKEGEGPGKGHYYFMRQTLVCTKPWFKRDLKRGRTKYHRISCLGMV